MQSDAPVYQNDGTLRSVFNIQDFEQDYGYVSFADLKRYANLFTVNIFQATNFFSGGLVFSNYINNVSSETFDYLKNVSLDIQQQFDAITTKLQNYIYDATSNTQAFTTFTAFNKLASNNTQINNSTNNNTITNAIIANKMNCSTIKCSNIYALNLPIVYINNIPISKGGLLSKLNISLGSNNTIYLQNGFSVKFYNNLKIPILTYTNTTNDILYYNNVDLTNIISLEIFML